MGINHAFDTWNLTTAHIVLCIIGIVATLYVMQLWSRVLIQNDCFVIAQLRRVGFVALALGLSWAISLADEKQWQPWPPELLIIGAIDLIMIVGAAGIHRRLWRGELKA